MAVAALTFSTSPRDVWELEAGDVYLWGVDRETREVLGVIQRTPSHGALLEVRTPRGDVIRTHVHGAVSVVLPIYPIRQGYPHPIAYTYAACAARAFGVDESGFIPEEARDHEGNPIGAVAPWDEWHEPSEDLPQVLSCDTCGGEIDRVDA